MKEKRERRIDRGSHSIKMAECDGYVMLHRPRCMPYVMALKDWLKLPLVEEKK